MKKILIVIYSLALPFIATGCASVTGSTNQSLSVQTREQTGEEVVGASCELANDEGKWFVTTPGSVNIHKSNKDLQVSCKKNGFEPGKAAVVSDTKGAMFGNIILGGGIGAIIDHNNGSAYEYPTVIEILMGSFSKITSKKTPQTNATAPAQSATTKKARETDEAVIAELSLPAENLSGQNSHDLIAPEKDDPYNKLEKLNGLVNKGVITQEEYSKKKREILDSM